LIDADRKQIDENVRRAAYQQGLRFNALAAGVVVMGAALAVGIGALLKLDFAAVLGLLSGATTNTPSLGAAQQTLAALPGISEDRLALPALAYAVAYPAAIAASSARCCW